MKNQLLFLDFSNGIKHVPGFAGDRKRDLKDIFNMNIDDDGFLVPRPSIREIPVQDNDFGELRAYIPDEPLGITVGTQTFIPGARRAFLPATHIYYKTGKNLFIAHYLGNEEHDPVTRFYLLGESDSALSIRNGRLILITGDDGQYFIDIVENKRYDWNLEAPTIAGFTNATTDADFQSLVSGYIDSPPDGDHASNKEFPVKPDDKLYERTIVESWRAVYYNPELEVRSKSKQAWIRINILNDVERWLFDPNVPDDRGNNHDRRHQALRADELITQRQDLVSSLAFNEAHTFSISLEGKPDWATHVEIFRGELPEAYLIPDIEFNYDTTETILNTIKTIVGTVLTFIPEPVTTAIGVSLAVDGITGYFIQEQDGTIQGYRIDKEELANIDATAYQRVALQEIGSNSGDIEVNAPLRYADEWRIPEDAVFLDATFKDSPPAKLKHIIEHAGRVYGVDTATEEIVFSHIDGNGVSDWFAFPPQNKLSTSGSGIAPIEALEQMPDRGGLYVFKRNAIHYIDGKNIFSGLYDINVSAQTDIDASQYKKNVGCMSPKSIENDGSMVLFIGSDDQIYALSGNQAQPIGLSVKPYIQDLTFEQKQKISTTWHNQRFYITLNDSTLLLDTERKFWLRYDWELDSIHWDRGGKNPLSILYGVKADGTLFELNVDDDEDTFGIMLESNIQILPSHSRASGVYVYTDDNKRVKVSVTGNEPQKTVEKTFRPRLGNKYMQGVHVEGRQLSLKVECEEPISIDRIILQEKI